PLVVQRLKARPAIGAFEPGLVVSRLAIAEGQRDDPYPITAREQRVYGRAQGPCHAQKDCMDRGGCARTSAQGTLGFRRRREHPSKEAPQWQTPTSSTPTAR